MAKKQRVTHSAAMIGVSRVVADQLREHNNPIDWFQLEKAIQVIMIELKRDLGKWYSHEERFQFVLNSLISQITADYMQGTKNLSKRMGWKRTKTKNVV